MVMNINVIVRKILIIVLLIVLLIALCIIVSSLFFPYVIIGYPNSPIISVNSNYEKNIFQPNAFFKEKYVSEIYPKGEEIILSELQKVKKIDDKELKLDEIFRWEMHDWHNPLWEPNNFHYFNQSINYISYNNESNKIRTNNFFAFHHYRQQTPSGVYYGNDPYWIAYNKVGACQELSNLFAYMAAQSGIKSRTVQTIWDHQWVEVEINGEWKYYDPWCAVEHGYYNSSDENLTFKSKWYNYPENFRDNCHGMAYVNFYNDVIPNPVATQVYSYSYIWHDIKKFVIF